MGPHGYQAKETYLRTAVSVDAQGWAQFGYVRMPEYRWGIFLAEPEPGRRISFGDHKGAPAWQEVPGEYRGVLRRLIVTQGDTEPASVEQQRHLGRTCPSLYDLRNLFQVNVEEGRHLWAMVDRKSTRLNSSHSQISYAVFCLKKKTTEGAHCTNA